MVIPCHPTIVGDIMGISTNPYEWGDDRPEGNWFPTYHHLQNRLDIMGPAKTLIHNIYLAWSRWYSESSGVSESDFFHSTMISRNMQTHTQQTTWWILTLSTPNFSAFVSCRPSCSILCASHMPLSWVMIHLIFEPGSLQQLVLPLNWVPFNSPVVMANGHGIAAQQANVFTQWSMTFGIIWIHLAFWGTTNHYYSIYWFAIFRSLQHAMAIHPWAVSLFSHPLWQQNFKFSPTPDSREFHRCISAICISPPSAYWLRIDRWHRWIEMVFFLATRHC